MKLKTIFPVVLCILIGFFMGNFMFSQYGKAENLTAVGSTNGENLKFLQAGVYSSKESMEEGMKNFTYYIYSIKDNMYYTYIGITKEDKNLEKLKNHFKEKGYEIYVAEIYVDNPNFLTTLNQYETVLKETTDSKTIDAICSQVLSKYEEIVLND